MDSNRNIFRILLFCIGLLALASSGQAQSAGSSTIQGVVTDPTGAVVTDATVEIKNPVSGFERSAKTDDTGAFSFSNVPFNPYHLMVIAPGFAPLTQDVEVRSTVPLNLKLSLEVAGATASVTVQGEAGDLLETDSTYHTDVDRSLIDKLPLESQSSSLSSLVTLASPGIAADSNGLFHGLGDHAENSFSVDGQPITDQQSKVFSNQIPLDSVQSLEVISGAPPAEFGGKTSLVIVATTRSGQGVTTPHGSVTASYGSFGSPSAGFDLTYGGQKWGNFIAANGLNTSRFLDPPELQSIHNKGNEENLFDRVDFQLGGADSIHTNFQYTRSWFQTPNTIDNLNVGVTNPLTGAPLPEMDQRAQIKTFNIAPVWTRLISSSTLFTFGGFVRQDRFNYYPSGDVFADGTGLIPGGSSATLNQQRKLTNAGLRSDVSYVKGKHNVKAGVMFQHTFLTENFNFGITDPNFLPGLGCPNGNLPPDPCAVLPPFDLTRGGALFPFRGHADVKELGLYLQDTITQGNWSFNLGIRADVYRGIVRDWQPEPRVGVAYNIKRTNSVLRLSYSRILESPFNENLILASLGASNPVIVDVIGGASLQAPIRSGQRNQFNAGFQQAFGKFLVVDADYLWKYTHNAYDFSAFGNTPIFFPIAWKNSKIDGPSVRVSLPNYHGLTAFAVLAHVRARYFPPQVGGLGASVTGGEVFRIDHDQAFNQTTHLQYQPWKTLPWIGFNWRYDSGLVASNAHLDNFQDAMNFLDADQQAAIGLFCGTNVATPANRITSCAAGTPQGAKLINIAGATFDVDHHPTRVVPRNLFDASVGDDNLFHGDLYKWSLRLTVINLTNKTALYNFLSTFSGTHFVTPRAYTAQLGFNF
jgi:hypothetical protein